MAEEGHKVTLNVYDLSQGMARQLSATFLGKSIEGIWHTGIVVYGNEYYFGGGIQHDPVGRTPYGEPVRVVDLGVTHVPEDVFGMYLQEISPRYTVERYSLLSHNCNDFTNEVAQFLVGTTIPDDIRHLPNEVLASPMGAIILPMIQQLEETMRTGGVAQALEFFPIPGAWSQGEVVRPSQSEGTAASREDSSMVAGDGSRLVEAEGDPLGSARKRVQEDIGREFAAIMATGTLRASEAAALAARRVMQRYGQAS